jgi:hypothetical protein
MDHYNPPQAASKNQPRSLPEIQDSRPDPIYPQENPPKRIGFMAK